MAVVKRNSIRTNSTNALARIKIIREKYGSFYRKFEGLLKAAQVDLNDISARLLNLSDY